jgi:hypothetical protein
VFSIASLAAPRVCGRQKGLVTAACNWSSDGIPTAPSAAQDLLVQMAPVVLTSCIRSPIEGERTRLMICPSPPAKDGPEKGRQQEATAGAGLKRQQHLHLSRSRASWSFWILAALVVLCLVLLAWFWLRLLGPSGVRTPIR